MIQRATRDDAAALHALLATQLREHHVEISDDALAGAIAGVFDDPSRGAFLLAQEAGRAVGVAYASFIWSLEHGGRSLWLDELYVVPELRERGIGKALLDAVIALARDEKCRAIDLEVEADHARVESLYLREGFSPHARRRFFRVIA